MTREASTWQREMIRFASNQSGVKDASGKGTMKTSDGGTQGPGREPYGSWSRKRGKEINNLRKSTIGLKESQPLERVSHASQARPTGATLEGRSEGHHLGTFSKKT